MIQLTADDSQDESDQRDADSFPGHRVPTPSSRPSTSAQGLTFATALTLTAGVVLGATEGALAKLLGVPLAIVIAFLCVRAAGHHGQPRGAMRDGLLIAGVLVGVVLSAAVVIASLKAAPSSGPAPPVATNTKASGEASIATHTKAPASGAESELSRHVPATFRASCQRITRTGTADQLPEGTTAALSCHPDVGAAEVRYYRWLSPGQMDETFRFWLTTGSKFCKLDGKPMRPRDYSTSKGSGSVYCVDIGNGQVILNWTVDDMRVNAEAHADRGGLKALYDWWKGGGLWV